jgi:hydroxymethylpyrimidine pyrophosphatase-like HAD family hydrolase
MLPTAALSKLNGVNPRSIIGLFDYDLTLADKLDPSNPDHSPLMANHYVGLRDFSERIGRTIVITARGQESVLEYLGQHIDDHGRIPNITLASNSGHLWHKLDDKRPKEHNIIDIPGYTRTEIMTVTSNIHNLVTKMQKEFPQEITAADARELCGAIVAQIPGDKKSDRFNYFIRRADELKNALPEHVRSRIFFASKYWEDRTASGEQVVKGYTDMLPAGMGKDHTTRVLFDHYKNEVEGDPFVIVAGDSSADFKMMTALADRVPAARRLFISVGKGLVECDDSYAKENGGKKLLDIVLMGNGISPVQQLHATLDGIGRRQTALDLRKAAGTSAQPSVLAQG